MVALLHRVFLVVRLVLFFILVWMMCLHVSNRIWPCRDVSDPVVYTMGKYPLETYPWGQRDSGPVWHCDSLGTWPSETPAPVLGEIPKPKPAEDIHHYERPFIGFSGWRRI